MCCAVGWMAPVAEMLLMSDMQEVWATPLYDRPPMQLPRARRRNWKVSRPQGEGEGEGERERGASAEISGKDGEENEGSLLGRVTVLGDACHPMSMFKGQGANQVIHRLHHLHLHPVKQDRSGNHIA
jgi:2-polyprenyl-6-methoxyphenol hydroxylase-like FAD-dependent oxidoreductase